MRNRSGQSQGGVPQRAERPQEIHQRGIVPRSDENSRHEVKSPQPIQQDEKYSLREKGGFKKVWKIQRQEKEEKRR